MKEVKKIRKIQIIYDDNEASQIVQALEDSFDIIKQSRPDLEPPEILCELIEDLTWNEIGD